jgi:hypothetical protein
MLPHPAPLGRWSRPTGPDEGWLSPAQDGDMGLPHQMQAAPKPLLQPRAPYRAGLVGAVACLCTGYGLAARGAQAGRACGRGPALSRQAMPGGPATNDPRDAPKRAG